VTRHLLLMTATPHSGKPEDFQLWRPCSTVTASRALRDGVHTSDVRDLMRRMVKENLLTFDGRHLFPDRKPYTVQYDLSGPEHDLYDGVTEYVREQMSAAESLRQDGETRRAGTVGFALTVLQRRLANSPRAILASLERRVRRLGAGAWSCAQARRAARPSRTGWPTTSTRTAPMSMRTPSTPHRRGAGAGRGRRHRRGVGGAHTG